MGENERELPARIPPAACSDPLSCLAARQVSARIPPASCCDPARFVFFFKHLSILSIVIYRYIYILPVVKVVIVVVMASVMLVVVSCVVFSFRI